MAIHRKLYAEIFAWAFVLGSGFFLFALVGSTPRALAIPAFARKYQTSWYMPQQFSGAQ